MITRINMLSQISSVEGKISALEDRVIAPICNCRIATSFHNAACLQAILKAQGIPCPAHGFRFLGVFFPILLTEPVLPSDQQFCSCQSNGESETGSSFECAYGRRSELKAQNTLMKSYIRPLAGVYSPDFPGAAILSKVKRKENGEFDWESLTADALCAFNLAVNHQGERQKWMADTGRPLPKSIEIVRLFLGRSSYPYAPKSLRSFYKGR